MKETKLFELVTGTEMKPWLSLNNINTCENGWSNFSANLRVLSLKFLELTQFAWPNQSIYFNFFCAVPRDDVIESTRFLMRPPVIIPPWSIVYKEVYAWLQQKLNVSHFINNLNISSIVWSLWIIFCTPSGCINKQYGGLDRVLEVLGSIPGGGTLICCKM